METVRARLLREIERIAETALDGVPVVTVSGSTWTVERGVEEARRNGDEHRVFCVENRATSATALPPELTREWSLSPPKTLRLGDFAVDVTHVDGCDNGALQPCVERFEVFRASQVVGTEKPVATKVARVRQAREHLIVDLDTSLHLTEPRRCVFRLVSVRPGRLTERRFRVEEVMESGRILAELTERVMGMECGADAQCHFDQVIDESCAVFLIRRRRLRETHPPRGIVGEMRRLLPLEGVGLGREGQAHVQEPGTPNTTRKRLVESPIRRRSSDEGSPQMRESSHTSGESWSELYDLPSQREAPIFATSARPREAGPVRERQTPTVASQISHWLESGVGLEAILQALMREYGWIRIQKAFNAAWEGTGLGKRQMSSPSAEILPPVDPAPARPTLLEDPLARRVTPSRDQIPRKQTQTTRGPETEARTSLQYPQPRQMPVSSNNSSVDAGRLQQSSPLSRQTLFDNSLSKTQTPRQQAQSSREAAPQLGSGAPTRQRETRRHSTPENVPLRRPTPPQSSQSTRGFPITTGQSPRFAGGSLGPRQSFSSSERGWRSERSSVLPMTVTTKAVSPLPYQRESAPPVTVASVSEMLKQAAAANVAPLSVIVLVHEKDEGRKMARAFEDLQIHARYLQGGKCKSLSMLEQLIANQVLVLNAQVIVNSGDELLRHISTLYETSGITGSPGLAQLKQIVQQKYARKIRWLMIQPPTDGTD